MRFWKTRIEQRDADKTFSVGLIYGPSGCGKSSFVRAGLMPSLSDTRFAFCQTLPIEHWKAVADALRESGYRPIRVRPFWNGTAVQLAAATRWNGARM